MQVNGSMFLLSMIPQLLSSALEDSRMDVLLIVSVSILWGRLRYRPHIGLHTQRTVHTAYPDVRAVLSPLVRRCHRLMTSGGPREK